MRWEKSRLTFLHIIVVYWLYVQTWHFREEALQSDKLKARFAEASDVNGKIRLQAFKSIVQSKNVSSSMLLKNLNFFKRMFVFDLTALFHWTFVQDFWQKQRWNYLLGGIFTRHATICQQKSGWKSRISFPSLRHQRWVPLQIKIPFSFILIWKKKQAHGVWKSQRKSHSTLRAKQATFTFWVDKS